MESFRQHCGIAAPLLQANIDTDTIIPSREMKSVSKHGLADGLFAPWRYLDSSTRAPNPDFVLNQNDFRHATILLAGDNFGCGSSREHAVWALREFGIRAIIAPGFGSIFFNNCIGNGLLPVSLPAGDISALAQAVGVDPVANRVSIDLETQRIGCAALGFGFTLEEEQRQMLLQGLDPINLTLLHEQAIATFESRDRKLRPWAYTPFS